MPVLDQYTVHAQAVAAEMTALGAACPQLGWNNGVYQCLPSASLQESSLSPGGFSLGAQGTITVLASSFAGGPHPQPEQQINYPAGTPSYFTIEGVQYLAGRKLLRLHLVKKARL